MADQTQIAVRIPSEWLPQLDALAEALSRPGIIVTRTDVLRATIARGLLEMKAELKPTKGARR